MQYAPTGVRSTSTNKEYFYADGRVHIVAYAIRPYLVTTNFYR